MSRWTTVVTASALLVALSASASAQTSRWDRRVEPDTLGEAPAVRVWIDGPRSYGYGDAVRVRFAVAEDAHVIVARVDGNGHLTLLHPANRSRSTLVRGGTEVQVRSRNSGSFASFYATDRTGGGYVFAMASYDPFDLSRLGLRDFDRYVTGTYVGRPSRSYIGDPYRVVTRFASAVLFDDETQYDFDVDYYDVGGPSYITSVGYSSYCGGYGFAPIGRYGQLHQRWDDELYYGGAGSAYASCGGFYQCSLGASYFFLPYSTLGYPICGGWTQGTVASGPQQPQPPMPPIPSDSGRVRGPLVDSISGTRPNPPNPVGSEPAVAGDRDPRRPRIATGEGDGFVYGGNRRGPIDTFDGDGRSFSIPERALTNLRRRTATEDGTREGGRELPTRPGARQGSSGNDDIQWVRPPVEVIRGGTTAGDQALPRPFRRDGGRTAAREGGSDGRDGFDRGRFLPPGRGDGGIGDAPQRFTPPSRTDGPRFVNPPSINAGGQIRQDAGGNMPRSPEAGRAEPPRIQMERPTPPPQSPPPPAAKDPSPPDKKPN